MPGNGNNVLRRDFASEQSFGALFGRVSSDEYRIAVSRIVNDIQAEKGLDDEQLGERLGVSEGTVANARNRRGNLDPVTMLNLGALFGGADRLSRILALVNGSPADEMDPKDRLDRALRDIELVRKGLPA